MHCLICVILIPSILSLECNFDFSKSPPVSGPYSCSVEVANNETVSDIDARTIPGEHLDDMSDNDVTYIAIASVPVKSIPRNLFVRFKNVRRFACYNTSLEALKNDFFENATILEDAWLHNNQINTIEENFSSDASESLKNLILSNNKISSISVKTFGPMNALTDLYLDGNLITKLAGNIFSKLSTLFDLSLDHNQIDEIDEDAFSNLSKLQVIYLDSNNIKELKVNVLKPLKRLNKLSLNNNQLSYIDKGLFSDFEKLAYVEIARNRIKFLNFITKLPQLVELDMSFNEISAIEDFDSSLFEHLSEIKLYENICVNKKMNGNYSKELDICFKNYRRPKCKFYEGKNGYTCDAVAGTLQNPNMIIDDHIIGKTDSDVRYLRIHKINDTFSLPVLSSNFKNLKKIHATKFGFVGLDCTTIKEIDFRFHGFAVLKSPLKCLEIERLFLIKSGIRDLPNDFFNGIAMVHFIDFSNNALTSNDLDTFKNLSTLTKLYLSSNQIAEIGEKNFELLTNLKVLKLNDNKIREVQAGSFQSLLNLRELHLEHNGIFSMPHLNNLNKLIYLNLEGNQLVTIAFSLPSRIQYADFSYNKIQTINSTIFSHLKNLNSLMLAKNNCINENIKDIQFLSLNISMYMELC